MDYDELVKRLRVWSLDERRGDGMLLVRTSDAIVQLQARVAELEHANSARVDQAERERDALKDRDAMAQMNAPAIAMAALQPPRPIIMPAQDWELNQEIQRLNERLAYLEPIFIAARDLVDNAEEYECDGLGLFAQHGWWEPLHDALDPDGSAAADDIRQPVAPAK